MPGRKSNVSMVSNGPEEGKESTPVRNAKEGMSVEDLSLPKSMIQRLAKGVLPPNTQIQKDALLALHKSATVFVSYIASNSSENAQAGGKKTIAPHDVTAALKDAEFESFLPRLEAELKKYNDMQCDKRNTYRRKIKEEKAAAAGKDGEPSTTQGGEDDTTMNGDVTGDVDIDDPERPFKKFKGENGSARALDGDGDEEEDDAEQGGENEDGEDDDAEDDDVPEDDEDDDDETEAIDVTMANDDEDEMDQPGEMRDEALDDPDSD